MFPTVSHWHFQGQWEKNRGRLGVTEFAPEVASLHCNALGFTNHRLCLPNLLEVTLPCQCQTDTPIPILLILPMGLPATVGNPICNFTATAWIVSSHLQVCCLVDNSFSTAHFMSVGWCCTSVFIWTFFWLLQWVTFCITKNILMQKRKRQTLVLGASFKPCTLIRSFQRAPRETWVKPSCGTFS